MDSSENTGQFNPLELHFFCCSQSYMYSEIQVIPGGHLEGTMKRSYFANMPKKKWPVWS
jgi:hypothetical protein